MEQFSDDETCSQTLFSLSSVPDGFPILKRGHAETILKDRIKVGFSAVTGLVHDLIDRAVGEAKQGSGLVEFQDLYDSGKGIPGLLPNIAGKIRRRTTEMRSGISKVCNLKILLNIGEYLREYVRLYMGLAGIKLIIRVVI